MELHVLYIMKMVLPVLLVLGVIILIVGMGWRTYNRRRQDQLARETARSLYGVGRPRYKPQRTFMLTMRTIIEKCKDQRRKGEYQFAVLFFVQDIKKLNNIYIDSNYELWNNYNNSYPLCNYEKTFWPDAEKFCNYMVSRHENPKHAEEIILDQFIQLWDKYLDTKIGKKPSYVILYSWLMLCSGCTHKLLGLMRDNYKPTKFVVVYTPPAWDGESEEIAERSRNELLSAGIEVYCVKYDKFLPPGEQPGDSDQVIDIESEQEFPPLLRNI
jgi:hypothetical protein